MLELAVPWAHVRSRYTILMERFVIDVLQQCATVLGACRLLRLSWDEVWGIQRGLAVLYKESRGGDSDAGHRPLPTHFKFGKTLVCQKGGFASCRKPLSGLSTLPESGGLVQREDRKIALSRSHPTLSLSRLFVQNTHFFLKILKGWQLRLVSVTSI